MHSVLRILGKVKAGWPLGRIGTRRLAILAALLAAPIAIYHAAMARLGPPPLDSARVVSKLVLDRNGNLLRPFTTPDGVWRLPVTTAEVDPRYFKLLFAFEDKRFHEHGGVDGFALGRAVWQFIRHRGPISGGSTLTMQAARLLDNRPTHSYRAKFGQMFRAWQLEGMMSKDEVLELYMRLAPFGGNIEGVRAASLAYFGKEPRRLTLAEAALLVALPQSPERRRPDRNAEEARKARDRVLDRAAGAGVITAAEAHFAKQQKVDGARHNFPALAPHLSERLAGTWNKDVIKLVIDGRLQAGVEAVVNNHATAAGPRLSAAAMVIDHASGAVLAHVGSANYFDHDRNGPIDMTLAIRSPGSALKPFIYGLAFEAGNAHPETTIQDRPVRFGRYAPENFDDVFHGTVSVRQALQLSLNVPAVKLLAAVGPARLSSRVRAAGFDIDVPRNLSVALGGVGLQLEQLAGMYTALARGGEPVPLHFIDGDLQLRHLPSEPLLRPAAAWYIADILRGAPPPAHAKGGGIAFKTGTSYGYRDAWAAGFDGKHVVVVWLGRSDGSSTPGLTGLIKAAPMLFDIFAQIGPERVPLASAPGSAIKATNAALPPPLIEFREADSSAAPQPGQADPPVHIAFPPDRAELELAQGSGGSALPLAFKAEGGMLPLTWLVNGAPIETAPHRREAFWTPSGEGFVNLSVIDSAGNVDRITVRLR
jgi:penicillin-binding protein 1C